MDEVLATHSNFQILSLKDLLLARDLYHYHLMNKAHVVGTAVGLYLIRASDPYPMERTHTRTAKRSPKTVKRKKPPRTLAHSEVRDYSWPCVLAFVDAWISDDDFGTGSGELHPDEMVPKTLYLSDGRMVPVCVVEATESSEGSLSVVPDWHWPADQMGSDPKS